MRRTAAHLAIALSIGLLAGAAPALAQDPAASAAPASAICGVLTAEEVAAAFGDDLAITSSDDASCTWDSYGTGGSDMLSVSLAPGMLEDIKSATRMRPRMRSPASRSWSARTVRSCSRRRMAAS